jgi:hypothetical protein
MDLHVPRALRAMYHIQQMLKRLLTLSRLGKTRGDDYRECTRVRDEISKHKEGLMVFWVFLTWVGLGGYHPTNISHMESGNYTWLFR